MDDFFHKPSENEWIDAVKASLKIESDLSLEHAIDYLGIEGLMYHANPNQNTKETYLNTFPTTRILGREIFIGQPNVENMDVGIDYIFSYHPVIPHADQKIIQIIDKKENKDFGDEVLLDIFCLLEQLEYSHDNVVSFLEKKIKTPNVHLLIDGTRIHNAGGNIVSELSHMLFWALKYADLFTQHKRKVCFMVSVDSQFYAQVAKLRALRYLFETILEKENLSTDHFLIMAASSLREMTLYDPWMNMLRVVAGTTASFMGGADVILPKAFDVLNQIHSTQESSDLALRQSRNVFHVLSKESSLDFVNDPARGSLAIEDLTNQIIQKTFVRLKEMNNQKSLRFLYEKISKEVELTSKDRLRQLQTRNKTLCGINNFSNIAEQLKGHFKISNLKEKDELFPLRRVAREYELLRLECEELMAKKSRKILVLTFGDLKKINQRVGFCTNYFEILGIEVVNCEIQSLVNFNPNSYAGIVYCAQDTDYDEMFQISEIPNLPNLFIAGNKYHKQDFVNIYQGQNIIEVLAQFIKRVGEL